MSRRWLYILQEAAIGLRRNLTMTIAVVLSVGVSLMLFGGSVLLRQQVDIATGAWTSTIEVSIFLCDGNECATITPEQQASLQSALESNPRVDEVIYESKSEAYERFLDLYANNEAITEGVSRDQLPASFRVKLVDPEEFSAIATEYEAFPGVEEIVDQREILQEFLVLARGLRWSALTVAIIQMVAATVLVANTVRVAAFARRDQTQIMKLVGSSNWYIRLPFVLEGILAGLAGAVVAWGTLIVGLPWLIDQMDQIQLLPWIGVSEAVAVWPWLFAPAVVISGTSSLVALWGFLDV